MIEARIKAPSGKVFADVVKMLAIMDSTMKFDSVTGYVDATSVSLITRRGKKVRYIHGISKKEGTPCVVKNESLNTIAEFEFYPKQSGELDVKKFTEKIKSIS